MPEAPVFVTLVLWSVISIIVSIDEVKVFLSLRRRFPRLSEANLPHTIAEAR